MARVVVMGAGISGHTAATRLRSFLPKKHEVVVVSPNAQWNWVPSNVWVGVGTLKVKDVLFDLAPVYKKAGIVFRQAKAISIHPEGDKDSSSPYITVEYTEPGKVGHSEKVTYDYLINSTGPKLNFAATPGLGPEGHSHSICTADHALHASKDFLAAIEKMKKGQKQTFLIGVGHGMATCQGAAFEYIFNVEFEIRRRGLRDLANIVFITNEHEVGDFGMGGVHLLRGGYYTHSKIFAESFYTEKGIKMITRAHVTKVEAGVAHFVNLADEEHKIEFDFAMLIPPFAGVGLTAFDKSGKEIKETLFAPNGLMKVDADYTPKAYEEWKAADWPKFYQNPAYNNIFVTGIAFAPPHFISKPMKNSAGTMINPTPPRTGMVSGIIALAVAQTVASIVKHGGDQAKATFFSASMAEIGAACVASAGKNFLSGRAAGITVYPVVPDYEKFPVFGRDPKFTTGEIGLGAHWIKIVIHHMFIWKAKMKPGWTFLPE